MTLFASSGQFPTPLFSYPGSFSFTTDRQGRIYTAVIDDRGTSDPGDDQVAVQIHGTDGSLFNANYVTGLQVPTPDPSTGYTRNLLLAIDPKAVTPDLYLLLNGSLYRYDVSGNGHLLGSGFAGFASSIRFGPDGNLYIAENNGRDVILRLTPTSNLPVTVRVDDDRGGFDTQSYTIDVSGAATGEIHGAVTDGLDDDLINSCVLENG